MNLIGGLIGGAVGGLIGGAIWTGVAYGTGYEIGWIAWGVGAIVGVGVSAGSKGEAGQIGGVMAATLAIASILIAKYAVVQLMVSKHIPANLSISVDDVPAADQHEHWTAYIADQLISDRMRNGQAVNWPAGVNPDEAESEGDYPKDIWTDAKSRWEAMSAQNQSAYRDTAAAALVANFNNSIGAIRSEITSEGFFQSFGAMDLLFGALALATAFRLGSSELAGSRASE
jgi:hypothetical protein